MKPQKTKSALGKEKAREVSHLPEITGLFGLI
jgi:hypothetical protein